MERNIEKRQGSGVKQFLQRAAESWLFHVMLAGLIIVLVFLHPPLVFSGDTDTARNYLNTIVSSLSTILALCISIILVGIQLAASNYTHRVLDFYVRLPYNGSLFLLYIVTIMHSFLLMAKIHDPVRDPLPRTLQPEMSADLVLVFICYISLILYMYAITRLLKPEQIIRLILREYDRAASSGRWTQAEQNVEQICDIAKRAASVSDSVTGTVCLKAMLTLARELPIRDSDSEVPGLSIHQHFVSQWTEIIGVAVKEQETGLLKAVVDALHEQGCHYVDHAAWRAAELVVKALKHVVFHHLLPAGQQSHSESVAEHLYTLAAHAAKRGGRGHTFALRTWDVIRVLGESTFRRDGVPASLTGFLMVKEVPDVFHELEGSPEHRETEGLFIYFDLWRVFLESANRRDVARWAEWWKEEVGMLRVFSVGQSLSLLLAEYLKAEDAKETLQNVWKVSLNAADLRCITEDRRLFAKLFDGLCFEELSQDI